MYGNIIWFECKSENIIVSLETDLRPVVGDNVLLNGKNYKVYEVKWIMDQKPGQCGIIAYIEQKKENSLWVL